MVVETIKCTENKNKLKANLQVLKKITNLKKKEKKKRENDYQLN